MIPDRSLVQQARNLAANDNLSTREISRRLGISKSTINRWIKDLSDEYPVKSSRNNLSTEQRRQIGIRAMKERWGQPQAENKSDERVDQSKLDATTIKPEPHRHPPSNKALIEANRRKYRDRDRYLGRDGWSRFEYIL